MCPYIFVIKLILISLCSSGESYHQNQDVQKSFILFPEMSTSGTSTMNLPTNSSVDSEDLSILVQELRELGFDAIRFASYRTAAKLRFIQKKSNCKFNQQQYQY